MLRISKVKLIFKKDWMEISRNWQIIMPIVVVPLIFSAVLPLMIIFIPSLSIMPQSSVSGLKEMISHLPSHVRSQLLWMDEQQVLIYIFVVYFFAPFFLIIPLMSSSVIASYSFAGEKERRTIEALLATPISDSELILGKILASFIPSLFVTILSFIIYSITVDLVSFNIFGNKLLLPNILWIILIFGLSPAVAFASIGLTVMISAKARGFREAQQISVILLIPIFVLVFGQAIGVFFLEPLILIILIEAFIVTDIFLFYISIKLFKREEILSRLR